MRLLPHLQRGRPPWGGAQPVGIVGANHARAEGFRYSAANQARANEPWTFEALNAFIANPRAAMPGTTMGFNGIASAQQRADLIAYLRTLSHNPVPLP